MRLLQRLPGGDFELTSFDDDHPPPYAILSHTWAKGQEVTYNELVAGAGRDKTGFDKIRFCGERAAADGLQYFWVDTCCINKSTSDELSTAINSMFYWYQRASKCYVYLSDVSLPEEVPDTQAFPITWCQAFRQSRWFTRGWTLQELLAPASVEFFSKEGKRLGSKITLEQEIYQTTKIPIRVLRGQSLAEFSVEERMSWAATRITTLKEDKVYCLLGIFGVFLPLIYGEGEAYATLRLKEEIQKRQEVRGTEQTNNNYHADKLAPASSCNRPWLKASSPTARPETPPRPSCAIPFRRDRDFVDHGTLLDQIRERCCTPASHIALVGLGGVGKSQLAIEHCYRTAEHSPETWVFWVHASNAARIEQGYRAIADQVELADRNDPHADVFQLVHNWLRNEKNGRWLLVLDNADDAAAFSLPASGGDGARARPRPLSSYLPQSEHGAILVTSRTRGAALQLVEEDDIIAVEPMDDAGAQALLQKKLGQEVDKSSAAELARAVEFMPLALVQAAAYIRQRAPRCSVRQYLVEFYRSDRERTSLLDYDGGRLRRDEDAKNAILITWQISFDHIRHARRSAADLLSLMSFFDRQGIPEALVRNRGRTGNRQSGVETVNADNKNSSSEDSESETSTDDGFEEDVLMLRSYSFITLTTNATAFDMHRLVQLALRKWLEEQGQLEMWKQRFINNLCAWFPTVEHKNWPQCQVLFPHAKSALSQPPKSKESLEQWALLLYHTAQYACQKGSIKDAEELSVKSMKVRKRLLGKEHMDTVSSMAMVALAMQLAGRWKEAEELHVQVMETRKRMLGDEHLGTLVSMSNLALTYRGQGRWKEAEELQVQVTETRKRVLGDEHSEMLTHMNNLASTYEDQGRWKEAEELHVQVMETSARVLGDEHPDTLTSMNNLASTYRNQGRPKEAEELQVQVMETRKRVLGDEHPDTLTSMNNLASTYRNRGRWKEAEELQVQVMKTSVRVLGDEHPSTLTSMNNLASMYRDRCRWKEAEELQVQVMKTSARVLGDEHPDTLTSMNNLALTYRDQSRWKEAEELQVLIMETRKRMLGDEHPGTLTSMYNLASTYRGQSRWKEAEELQAQVMKTSARVLGDEHLGTLTSMNELASTYGDQGRWKEAEELQVQVMKTSARVLGDEHPDTLTSMNNLAFTFKIQGRTAEAIQLMDALLQVGKRVFGPQHPNILSSSSSLDQWRQEKKQQQQQQQQQQQGWLSYRSILRC